MATTPATTPQRRYDPQRRDRIIDACLEVIAENGVACTSHRKVAEAADVPLGSMSYHFTGMDALLHEALSRFAQEASGQFEDQLAAAHDPGTAEHALRDRLDILLLRLCEGVLRGDGFDTRGRVFGTVVG